MTHGKVSASQYCTGVGGWPGSALVAKPTEKEYSAHEFGDHIDHSPRATFAF